MFHARHHRILTLFAAGLALFLFYRLYANPVLAPAPGAAGAKAGTQTLRLDPNTATQDELDTIPGLGPTAARAIVEYREKRRAEEPGAIVFRGVSDLDRIPHVGPETLRAIEPFLVFPP